MQSRKRIRRNGSSLLLGAFQQNTNFNISQHGVGQGFEDIFSLVRDKTNEKQMMLRKRNKFTAVPYIFEIVTFVLLFELALIVFLNYPFPVFPFR